jgi:hypothetical protein
MVQNATKSVLSSRPLIHANCCLGQIFVVCLVCFLNLCWIFSFAHRNPVVCCLHPLNFQDFPRIIYKTARTYIIKRPGNTLKSLKLNPWVLYRFLVETRFSWAHWGFEHAWQGITERLEGIHGISHLARRARKFPGTIGPSPTLDFEYFNPSVCC